MPRFICSLRCRSIAVLGVLVGLAIGFWVAQNHMGWHGGAVALPKLLWLFTAIWAWYFQPALVLVEKNVPQYAKRVFTGFLIIMAVRALVEGVMLYVTYSWSPWYGIAFNGLVFVWLMHSLLALVELDKRFLRYVLILALMFVAESGFAWYMQKYFNTVGQHGVYFVPDSKEHQMILRVTWGAVLASWLWQGWIIRRGLWRTH